MWLTKAVNIGVKLVLLMVQLTGLVQVDLVGKTLNDFGLSNICSFARTAEKALLRVRVVVTLMVLMLLVRIARGIVANYCEIVHKTNHPFLYDPILLFEF